MKHSISLKTVQITAAFFSLILFASSPVKSTGIPVVDVAHIGVQGGFHAVDIAEQVIISAENVLQTVEDVEQTIQQIQMVVEWAKNLDQLGASEWAGLINDTVIQSDDIGVIIDSVDTIKYNAATVKKEINSVFPKDGDWTSFDFSTIKDRRKDWNKTLSQAVVGAMKAQSRINTIAQRNAKVVTLLNESDGADGNVRQQQAGNELTAVMIASVNDMNQSIAASQRMVAVQQQQDIADREADSELNHRAALNFTDPGPTVAIPTSFPKVE